MSNLRYDVVALGYCALDYLAVVPRMPEIDTKLEMLDFLIQGGGPAATAAVTAARLGARTAFIGQTGDDGLGRQMLEELASEGVDTSHTSRSKGARSQFSFILVDRTTGKRTIVWTRSQVPPLDPDAVDEGFVKSCRVLHLDRHEVRAARKAAEWAREAGAVVSLDAGTYAPEVEQLLPMVDVLITSEAFAREAIGEQDPVRCAEALRRGRRIAGVTMGDRGSVFSTPGGSFRVPAFRVSVVDTTGAGDVFHGAFAYGVAQGWDSRKCAAVASAVAALKCTQLGGRSGISTLGEAEELIARAGDAWKIEDL